jgi:hypothetical protein
MASCDVVCGHVRSPAVHVAVAQNTNHGVVYGCVVTGHASERSS